jgi:YcxB-like protein
MTLRFSITHDEYSEFTKYFNKKAFTGNLKWYGIIILTLFFINLYFSTTKKYLDIESSGGISTSYTSTVLNWLLLFVIFIALWWLIIKRVRKKTLNVDAEILFAERQMVFEEEKVYLKTDFSETTYKWFAFNRFEQTSNIFILFITSNMAVIIPKRAFDNPQQKADFEILVKRKIANSQRITTLENPNVLDA